MFEEKVTIQYYYPNFNPDIIDGLSAMGYRGMVIAGTGLGHVNKPLYPAIKRAIQKGMTVVMTVQTLWGFAQMYVYDTGPRPARPRHHPARQHAARDGLHEARLGARADRRPGRASAR